MPKFKLLIIILLVAWLTSPVTGFLFLIWYVGVELSPISVLATLVYCLPFILLTSLYIFVFIKKKVFAIKRKLAYSIILSGVVIYFIVQNIKPYRIFLEEGQNDSPFDKWWYFSPQTAYGYPTPFYRNLDSPIEEGFKIIIDYSSFISNTFCLFGVLFFLTLFLSFIKQRVDPQKG